MEGGTIHYRCKDCGSLDDVYKCKDVYIESIRVDWNARDQQWDIDPNALALADKRCGDCQSWNIEEYDRGRVMAIFEMLNHHGEDAGTPPNVVDTMGAPHVYRGYFENCDGDQWIFSYDYDSKEALLKGGDAGWGKVFVVKNGYAINCHLRETERRWLVTCWKEATGYDYSQIRHHFPNEGG
jgi:hypothetical protein